MNGLAKGIPFSKSEKLFKDAEFEIKIKNPKYKQQAKIQILFDDLILEKFIIAESAVNIMRTIKATQLMSDLAEFYQVWQLGHLPINPSC